MTLFNLLLVTHIVAGTAALSASVVAVATKIFDVPHRWHVYSGRVFVWGMIAIFLTANPMALMGGDLFLFLISIFSVYLAVAGWRFAKNRRGVPGPIDWVSAATMAIASGVMIVVALLFLVDGNTNGVTLLVFGGFGALLSAMDLGTLRRGGVRGRERIANHLTMMMSGSIAAITAFTVTNVSLEPAFLVWLTPTAVIAPIIVWWNWRIRAGAKPKGMPEETNRVSDMGARSH